MKSKVNDLIFVFGNPIRKVEDMAVDYNITVVGTNTGQNLIDELKNANDASQFFFIVTDEEELHAVNEMFERLVTKSSNKEPNMFVIIQKKFEGKLRVGQNKVYVRDYEVLDETLLTELILDTTVGNQVQYFTEKEKDTPNIMTKEKMARTSRVLDSFDTENVLQGIRKQFGAIKQNQDTLSVSKVLGAKIQTGGELDYRIETQEFLKGKEEELKEKLRTAKSKTDIEGIMTTLLEIFNMRSDDLRETSTDLITKILNESSEDSERAKEESEKVIQEIEMALLDGDKREIEFLLSKREEYITNVKAVEVRAMDNANRIKAVTTKYLKDLKESSIGVLTSEYRTALTTESMIAFQEAYKSNGLAIMEQSTQLAENMTVVIDDLQEVVVKYNQIMTLDTNIIESQQRMVDTLSTQRVIERVEYSNSLTSKINLLVSPTPNLGASTMLRMFSNRWNNMLVLDFREVTSNPKNFKQISYGEFMELPIADLSEGCIKVNSELARVVEEEEIISRLGELEGSFDAIIIVVDKYMTTGVPTEAIQRIMYLSDTSDSNLLEVNRLAQVYEPLFTLNRRMFIMNRTTFIIKQNLNDKLTIAGIDPARVRVNTVPLTAELIDEDESEYKVLNSKFNYF